MQGKHSSNDDKHKEALYDEAVEESFPASDVPSAGSVTRIDNGTEPGNAAGTAAGAAMKVADVMTRDVISINATDTIRQAAMMMADLKVGSLPVCEGEKLVGTVTDRDIAVRGVAAGIEPTAHVIEIATRHVQSCHEDDDLETVKQKMAKSRIRRVPVVDRDERLIGIVSLGDLADADAGAGETLKAVSSPSRPAR